MGAGFLKRTGAGFVLGAALWACIGATAAAAPSRAKAEAQPLILAHYMPWYQSKAFSGSWGWHWTMNHFNPDRAGGRTEAASQFRPLVGLYDSNDPDLLECQVLLMKAAGIDGAIIDWYGRDDYYDYAANNRNSLKFASVLKRAGMKYTLCYESQTVPNEIKGGKIRAEDAVRHGQDLMRWTQANFFSSSSYVKQGVRPVFLTFGDPYYNDAQWSEILSVLAVKPLYVTENDRRLPSASEGGFDWPAPGGGTDGARKEMDSFYTRAAGWPVSIPAAYPRFDDIYHEAGVGNSYGHIEDRSGKTYADTLERALKSSASIVQLVTWNDWGEGTQIEPSVEFGYRDLETTQRLRRKYFKSSFAYIAQDLRLPVRWYLLRKRYRSDPKVYPKLSAFFLLMASGHTVQAGKLLARYKL
ncbi:MAG: glycoside hydrolase family 71/99-like protein [Capsulimonas sp.]|uniref:glycoside hydrolase family 71/99-like protein n=1 Tax=Capsulimonas sp. TaxID=2494211 RepID=UPI003266ED0B